MGKDGDLFLLIKICTFEKVDSLREALSVDSLPIFFLAGRTLSGPLGALHVTDAR